MKKRVKGDMIGGYTITFPISQSGDVIESYRVKDSVGLNYYLKLINLGRIDNDRIGRDHRLIEESIVEKIHHENLVSFHESFSVILDGEKFRALVFDFIPGITLDQHLSNNPYLTVREAKQIVLSLLEGLSVLHNQVNPITHNNLNMGSVMMDLTTVPPTAKIIDFSCANYFDSSSKNTEWGKVPFFIAPEVFNRKASRQSDLYSVGAILYYLIFGIPPFVTVFSKGVPESRDFVKVLIEEQRKTLVIPEKDIFELDEILINILRKALAFDSNQRFQTAEEMIHAIRMTGVSQVSTSIPACDEKELATINNGGFADVAGMQDLKDQLQSDVIDILQNPDHAKSLGLTLPNGLFFYGPPGCGKTYFAEKFAQEVGCNYLYVKCSDVASPYIHGGQGKIAEIFKNAREKAPSILFFDEIDAMLTDRSKQTNVSEAGEVNEFLAQLNNCGKDGVIVIGATNKPNQVDEAALRAGRLEYKYYIPPPDFETRSAIFELNLKHRKSDSLINVEKLAEMTEGFISADIKLIVDKAARMVFRRKGDMIAQSDLEEVIKFSQSSLTPESLKEHEAMRDSFMNKAPEKKQRRIGFY